MSDDVMILLSFLLFMFFFAGVGLASMRVKEDTTDDYLVAGRGMHPGLAALSAVSTWNSGYMFIGFIGFIYLQGYSAIWIAACLDDWPACCLDVACTSTSSKKGKTRGFAPLHPLFQAQPAHLRQRLPLCFR